MRVFVGVSVILTATSVAVGAHAQQTQTFTYDVHGRLTTVARTTGTSMQTTTYTLDDADNRTSRLLGAPAAAPPMVAPDSSDPMASGASVATSEAEPSVDADDTSQDTATDLSPDEPAA